MATQTLTLPAPNISTNTYIQWAGLNLPLAADLVSGSTVVELDQIIIYSLSASSSAQQRIDLSLALSDSVIFDSTLSFTEQFEQNFEITFGGETFSHELFDLDLTNRYQWDGKAADGFTNADIARFRRAILAVASAREITLFDGEAEIVVTDQTFDLPSPTNDSLLAGNQRRLTYELLTPAVDGKLIDGDRDTYIGRLRLNSSSANSANGQQIQLRLSRAGSTATANDADFTDAFHENFEFRFAGRKYTHENFSEDTSNPFRWRGQCILHCRRDC